MTEVEKKEEPFVVLCQFCAAVISESGSVSERRILELRTCSACEPIPEEERPKAMSADEVFTSYARSVFSGQDHNSSSASSIEEASKTPVSALSSTSDGDDS